jgi:type VI protein secretion system component Hcp
LVVSAADAGKKKTDKPSISEITVTKQSDTASPKLIQKSNAPKIKGDTTRQQR